MNHLPSMSFAVRLNAFAAAAVVTLSMLSGINALALADSGAPMLAQSVLEQPV